MNEKKITKEMKFDAVINALEGQDENLIQFIQEEKERYINRQNKAKERVAKKKAEADEIIDIVKAVIDELAEPATRDTIAEAVAERYDGDIEITPAKIGARLNTLVKNGEIDKDQATIDKRRKMVYAPAGYFDGAETE